MPGVVGSIPFWQIALRLEVAGSQTKAAFAGYMKSAKAKRVCIAEISNR